MSRHTTRGLRSVSMRVRLAVAGAVLVGGGAAGAIAVAASHSGAATVQNASYDSGYRHTTSQQTALWTAATGWPKSTMQTRETFTTLATMVPMRTFTLVQHQRTTLAAQRGVVEFVSKKLLVVKSFNGKEHVWLLSQQHGTKFFNVAPSNSGMAAMTGGSLYSMTGGWMSNNTQMMMTVNGLRAGDITLVVGVKKHTSLIAKLVLFIQPMTIVLLKIDSDKAQGGHQGGGAKAAGKVALKGLAQPRVWLPFIGIALVLLNVQVPKFVLSSLNLIGAGTTGLALLVSGIIISQEKVTLTRAIVVNTFIKNLLCPAIMLAIVLALGITGVLAKEAVLLVGLPSAVITTMFAGERGMLEAESATMILSTRVFSFISIPIVIAVTNYLLTR